MDTMEIVLVVLGILAFIGSFLLPGGKKDKLGDGNSVNQKKIKELVSKEMEQIKTQVDGVAEEAVEYSMEKTERALERLSNEKIMAVSEYSDTVLKEISNNHKEVMFLYDLLNEKQKSIKLTMAELLRTVKEAESAAQSAGLTPIQTSAQGSVSTQSKTPEYKQVATGTSPSAGQPVSGNAGTTNKVGFESRKDTSGSDMTGTHITFPVSQGTIEEQPTKFDNAIQRQREVNQNGRILELYQKGKSKVDIAKELGLGVGEVKLVLDLYQK
jgi:hypothetical protein